MFISSSFFQICQNLIGHILHPQPKVTRSDKAHTSGPLLDRGAMMVYVGQGRWRDGPEHKGLAETCDWNQDYKPELWQDDGLVCIEFCCQHFKEGCHFVQTAHTSLRSMSRDNGAPRRLFPWQCGWDNCVKMGKLGQTKAAGEELDDQVSLCVKIGLILGYFGPQAVCRCPI